MWKSSCLQKLENIVYNMKMHCADVDMYHRRDIFGFIKFEARLPHLERLKTRLVIVRIISKLN